MPTSDLLEQWFSTLELHLPGLSIGRRDITTAHTFDECDVLVSLVSAAFGHELLEDGRAGLVIADEVHKDGRPSGGDAACRVGARLGSDGVDGTAGPWGRRGPAAVLRCCARRVRPAPRSEGRVLAPFRLAFVAVDLDAEEQAEHDALTAQISELAGRVSRAWLHPGPVRRRRHPPAGRPAGERQRSRRRQRLPARGEHRRDLLATSSAKTDALATLAPTLGRSTHALVFTHTKDGADAAAAGTARGGVSAAWLHPGLEPEVRRNTLRDLRGDRPTRSPRRRCWTRASTCRPSTRSSCSPQPVTPAAGPAGGRDPGLRRGPTGSRWSSFVHVREQAVDTDDWSRGGPRRRARRRCARSTSARRAPSSRAGSSARSATTVGAAPGPRQRPGVVRHPPSRPPGPT